MTFAQAAKSLLANTQLREEMGCILDTGAEVPTAGDNSCLMHSETGASACPPREDK